MLLRTTANGVIAITQPAHAWISGQMAQAWGNTSFEPPTPRQEFCLAAALHDIGWLDWERTPNFDPKTGFPRVFANVLATDHTELWRNGIEQIAALSSYAGVLVSMHGETIYEKTFDAATAKPEQAAAVDAFLKQQQKFQRESIAGIRRDPVLAKDATDTRWALNKRLLLALDTMSLMICWGCKGAATIEDVPLSLHATANLTLTPTEPDVVTIDPWPFAEEALALRVEGRLLTECAKSAAGLARMLAEASLTTIIATLRRT